MDTETREQNNKICDKLYENELITYEKYLECTGANEQLRTGNYSDIHKYGISNDTNNINNIFNKQLFIYSSQTKEQLYLAYRLISKTADDTIDGDTTNNNDKLKLTTGIIDKNENIFVIEKVNDSNVVLKHKNSAKYVSYDIKNMTIKMTENKNVNTNFIMKSFNVNGLNKFKFSLINKDGKESKLSLIIQDNKVIIGENNTFSWDITNIDADIDIPELDILLVDIENIKNDYNNALYEYNYLFNKKSTKNNKT